MTELVGRNLGPYRITEPLGAGGMAAVYKAYQPSMDRYVAIKVLPRHFAQDPTFTGRFEQEAKVIAKLEHARILPVYDYGEDNGTTYIVMRYLDAGTLTDHLLARTMDLEEIARVIGQIAEGLDYAHSKGVIHRDVKPSNIMLAENGDVYITDFGISKLVEGTAQFTGSGIVGTPAYVSPEQGLGLKVDQRTDVYSLGVVLYQMATGSVPYEAETPMAVVIKHIHDPLPMPRSVKPELPESIERVILRAMAKEPDARYQSCGEMAQALFDAVAEARGEEVVGEETVVPFHEKTTEISTPTEQIVDDAFTLKVESPDTVPGKVGAADTMPAPVAVDEEPGTQPVMPKPVAEPAKRGWVLPVAIVAGLIVVGLIVAAVLVFGGGRHGIPAEEEQAPVPPEGEEPGGGMEPLPGGLKCKEGQVEILATTFAGEDEITAQLPPGAEVVELPDGKRALRVALGTEGPTFVSLGPEIPAGVLLLEIVLPEGPAVFKLHYGGPEEVGGLAVVYSPDQLIQLERIPGDKLLTEPKPMPSLSDGNPHMLMVWVDPEHIELRVDDKSELEWFSEQPLPPGKFALEVLEGMIMVNGVAICGPGEMGEKGEEKGPEAVFIDEFEGERLAPGWTWINEPEGRWEIGGGGLTLGVLPNTGAGLDSETSSNPPPMLVVDLKDILASRPASGFTVQVDLKFKPEQNFQSAGLIMLSERRQALFTLLRRYCDPDRADFCQGDALHFDHWVQRAEIVQGGGGAYRPFVTPVGDLPPESAVMLRMEYLAMENVLLASFSIDGGANWEPAGEWALLVEARAGFVGLITGTGGQDVESIPAFFDNFVIMTR